MARKNADDKKQEDYKVALNELLKEPGNKTCADCGAVAPRWASATLGVFLCIKCSGIHRSMGTHISFVRSVGLDDWKEHEIQKMKDMGNARSNELLEARVPTGYPRPKAGDGIGLERWIRDKYEAKRFIKKTHVESGSLHPTPNHSRPVTPVPSGLQRPPTTYSAPAPDLLVSEPEFGEFIAAPNQPASTPKPQTLPAFQSTPPPIQSGNTQPINFTTPDAKTNIMSKFNLHQQPVVHQQPVMQQTMMQYPYSGVGVPSQGQFYPVGTPGYPTAYPNQYYTPQYTQQNDILHKINTMALEKRQQEFAVFNNF